MFDESIIREEFSFKIVKGVEVGMTTDSNRYVVINMRTTEDTVETFVLGQDLTNEVISILDGMLKYVKKEREVNGK